METFCRVLLCLPYASWGTLAVTLALARWPGVTEAGTTFLILLLCGLLLSGLPWDKLDRSLRGRAVAYLLILPIMGAAVVIPVMLSRSLSPNEVAIWAALLAITFTALLYCPWWLARIAATVFSAAFSLFAGVGACVFIALSYLTEGSLLARLAKFPSWSTRIAAVVLAALAPVGLVAAWWIIREEDPWNMQRIDESQVDKV